MPRSNSLSGLSPYDYFPQPGSIYPSNAQPGAEPPAPRAPPPAQRTLKKSSSLADLAKRHLRKLKSRGDFDFGCAGDPSNGEIEELDEDEPAVKAAPVPPHHPSRDGQPFPRLSPSTPTVPPPSRPSAPLEVLDESHFTPEQLRALNRQREEALAAEACLDYISTHRHSRKTSKSSIHGIAIPTLERLNLHDRDVTATATGPSEFRPRSDSTSSASACSSRPRTNDSLPSFASSDAATYSSAGSFPPSPVQTSRPRFSGGSAASSPRYEPKIDPFETAGQPRAYAFI
ncbi:hypothetical protein JCM10212_002468 [Sporobolomyces blumeae]